MKKKFDGSGSIEFQSTLDFLQNMEEKAHDEKDFQAANMPVRAFLPGFDIGAMPNHINRSGLIAPIGKGPRTFHHQTKMVTRSDCVLEYTGEQLDEADGEIIMALIFMARHTPMGERVKLNRAALLQAIGRGTGSKQYEWLHRRLKAMAEATLFLEAKRKDGATRYRIGKMVVFRILQSLLYDDENERYSYTMDPRWVVLFGNREYSLLDWDKKMEIKRGMDMAKTLQRLVATSSDRVQRYPLEQLKAQMHYSSPMRKFREAISASTQELIRLNVLANVQIEINTRSDEQLVLWLPESI